VVAKAKFPTLFPIARKATWGGLWPSDVSAFYGVERTEGAALEEYDGCVKDPANPRVQPETYRPFKCSEIILFYLKMEFHIPL